MGFLLAVALALFFRLPGPAATADEAQQPFASSTEQRQQTVEELRKLNALMQKQIDLLASGKVKVILVERATEEKAEAERPRGR